MMPGLYVFAAVGIVAGALGFAGGWQTQGWRLGEQIAAIKSQQAEAVNTATREARATESRRYQEIHDAQVKSAARAQAARAAAAAAAAAGGGLRDDIAASLRASQDSAAACAQHAAALGGLLGRCEADYRGMAAAAQGHAGDVRLLLESWPR